MGHWWLAVSSWQHACSCVTSRAEFFGETSNHPGDSAPLQPIFGALWPLLFPKTKITFEKEEISDHWWNSGKYDRAAVVTERTVWNSRVSTLKGTEVYCPMYNVSYILYLLNKCLYFWYYMAGYLLDRLHISVPDRAYRRINQPFQWLIYKSQFLKLRYMVCWNSAFGIYPKS